VEKLNERLPASRPFSVFRLFDSVPAWASFAIVTVLMLAGAVWSYAIPPAELFNDKDLARLIVFHLPCAFTATLFLIWGSILSVRSLTSRKLEWDARAVAAMEIAFLMCALTMVTGILFSKVQWRAWWQWDPRQTSFLLVLLIVAAYFALRMAFSDEQRRAAQSAAYVVGSILPNLFLVFVLPRIMLSFHPSTTVVQGGFDRYYWNAILGVFAAVMAVSIWLYGLRVRSGILELALMEKPDGKLETDRGGAAPTGVVRPVAVSDSNVEKG
jgi:heme exporter protein C